VPAGPGWIQRVDRTQDPQGQALPPQSVPRTVKHPSGERGGHEPQDHGLGEGRPCIETSKVNDYRVVGHTRLVAQRLVQPSPDRAHDPTGQTP
jgi:hypothetical protein